jgi:hypothetical protein
LDIKNEIVGDRKAHRTRVLKEGLNGFTLMLDAVPDLRRRVTEPININFNAMKPPIPSGK